MAWTSSATFKVSLNTGGHIDDLISEQLKVDYIQRRRKELPHLRQALEVGNFNFLETVGHQIQGSSESFGFGPLNSLAVRLESCAQRKDAANIRVAIDDLERFLQTQPGGET
jgi:HPt (histidine-containing phosphotransfer) domain-containing protein